MKQNIFKYLIIAFSLSIASLSQSYSDGHHSSNDKEYSNNSQEDDGSNEYGMNKKRKHSRMKYAKQMHALCQQSHSDSEMVQKGEKNAF